ncbi:MAG: hypothetical protein ACJZ8K_00405 [Paracoccaceae bacterium]
MKIYDYICYDQSKKSNMQVIGIDPGLIHTGWAVIEEDGPKNKLFR